MELAQLDEAAQLVMPEDIVRLVKDALFSTGESSLGQALKGTFKVGRLPFIHEAMTPSGCTLRFKFYDTLMPMLDSKGLSISGKESWLSYLEITALKPGERSCQVKYSMERTPWGTNKQKASSLNKLNLQQLRGIAASWGIKLDDQAWCTIYTDPNPRKR